MLCINLTDWSTDLVVSIFPNLNSKSGASSPPFLPQVLPHFGLELFFRFFVKGIDCSANKIEGKFC